MDLLDWLLLIPGMWVVGVLANAILTLVANPTGTGGPRIRWLDGTPWSLRRQRVVEAAAAMTRAGFTELGVRREGGFAGLSSRAFWSEDDGTFGSIWRFAALWPFGVKVYVSLVGRSADGMLVHTGATRIAAPGIDSVGIQGDVPAILAAHRGRLAAHGGPVRAPATRENVDLLDRAWYGLLKGVRIGLGSGS